MIKNMDKKLTQSYYTDYVERANDQVVALVISMIIVVVEVLLSIIFKVFSDTMKPHTIGEQQIFQIKILWKVSLRNHHFDSSTNQVIY